LGDIVGVSGGLFSAVYHLVTTIRVLEVETSSSPLVLTFKTPLLVTAYQMWSVSPLAIILPSRGWSHNREENQANHCPGRVSSIYQWQVHCCRCCCCFVVCVPSCSIEPLSSEVSIPSTCTMLLTPSRPHTDFFFTSKTYVNGSGRHYLQFLMRTTW
jgi:hypothetical protein